MCEVTIVIPNYKGKEYLFSCVKSLYEKDQTEKKILIIDNASNDGSIEEVVKEYPEVELGKDKQMIPGKDAGDGFYIAIIKRVNHE